MWHEESVGSELFAILAELDEKIARKVAAAGCPECGGPLHRGDYERKPRGALLAVAGEAFKLRHSLCCGRPGCRKRALPPSLRFFGRRVYLEAVFLIATVRAMLMATLKEARAATGVPARTLRRWRVWWTTVFPTLPSWTILRARFPPPPPDAALLPKSMLDRFAETLPSSMHASDLVFVVSRALAPMTTGSVSDGSRFVHAALAP